MSNCFTPADKRWFKEFLAGFDDVRLKSDTSAIARCPNPHGRHANGDANPSLGLDLGENGSGPKALLHCRSQECEVESVLEALGKDLSDLYPTRNGSSPNALPGCTLEAYAAAKGLPVDFLIHEYVGLKDSTYFCRGAQEKVPAVWIPYMDESGGQVAVRYRTGLHKPTTGDDVRFRWAKGAELTLYGRNWLDVAHDKGYVFLVEGESDCHAAWYYEVPAIGVPGAQNWRDEWAVILDGIPLLIVTIEDDAGEMLWKAVSQNERLKGRLERVVVE